MALTVGPSRKELATTFLQPQEADLHSKGVELYRWS